MNKRGIYRGGKVYYRQPVVNMRSFGVCRAEIIISLGETAAQDLPPLPALTVAKIQSVHPPHFNLQVNDFGQSGNWPLTRLL